MKHSPKINDRNQEFTCQTVKLKIERWLKILFQDERIEGLENLRIVSRNDRIEELRKVRRGDAENEK